MVEVSTITDILCPVAKVFQYVCDPDNAPKWYVNIKSVVWQTPKPLTVGSRIAFTANFLGKTLSYTYEVIEMSLHKSVMKTAQGPFPMETTYLFEAIDVLSTRMTLQNRREPTGFSRLLVPFMSFMMKKAIKKICQS